MTEYWIPMILDFNQSYLIKDTLEKKHKKTHSLFLCNLSISRVFDCFTAANIIVKMPKIDTLDALGDDMTLILNTL